MQTDYNLTPYHEDMKFSSIMTGQEKDYCLLDGVSYLVCPLHGTHIIPEPMKKEIGNNTIII